jgi:ribonuclease R
MQKDIENQEVELVQKLTHLKALKLKMGQLKIDSKYKIGVIDISKEGIGFLSLLGDDKSKDLLVESHELNGASRGDIVLVKRIFTRSGRPKAKVLHIIKKEFDTTVVYLKKIEDKIYGINIKTEVPSAIAASQESLKKLPKNAVLKIDNYTTSIVEILGVLDDPKVDEKISLAIYNKSEFFSDEAENEAKSYGDYVDKSMYPNKIDLTNLPFCTIDPPDAKDFDDSIYFDKENSTLYVAIADVSEYVVEMGAIDKEARMRGFSIYFPHKSIPMLPRSLSENICSLKPHVDRLAFVYKITLDPNSYESVKEEMIDAVINSKRRYTYDQIDQFLAGDFSQKDEVDDMILSYLLPLNDFFANVRAKRLANGCEFRSREVRMILDENQNLIETRIESETPSHALIEDAMLLANKAAAKNYDKGIFRIHEQPAYQRFEQLFDDLALIGIFSEMSNDVYKTIRDIQIKADEINLRDEVDKLIIKAQKQATYASENKGHFGLGFEKYTHFTSPIRRYSDLIVHRLLKAIHKNDAKQREYILRNIDIIAQRVSELERESTKIAWDYMDRKFARWAKENIGNRFKAFITDVEKGAICTIEDEIFGARVFLLGDDVALFQEVEVEILESSITTTKIIGKVIKEEL